MGAFLGCMYLSVILIWFIGIPLENIAKEHKRQNDREEGIKDEE